MRPNQQYLPGEPTSAARGAAVATVAGPEGEPARRTVLGLLGLAVLTVAGCAPGTDDRRADALTGDSRADSDSDSDNGAGGGSAEPGTALWSFGAGRPSRGPATRYGDVVLCGSGDTLHALDAADGLLGWERRTGPASAAPLHHGDGLYVALAGSDASGMVVLDPADGSPRWRHSTRLGVFAEPVADGDTVYLCGLDRTVHALDAATGQVRWTFETHGQVFNSPVLHEGQLHVATGNGVMHTLDTADGGELRRFTGGGQPLAPVRAESGLLLLADRVDSRLYALDPATGEETWSVAAAGGPTGLATAGDTVLLGAGRRLTAFGTEDGEERWRADAAPEHCPVTVVGTTACHRSAEAEVVALDLETGEHRWSHEADGAVLHLATDGDILYLGADGKVLTALAV